MERDGGAWWAAIYGVAQSRTRLKRVSSSSSIQAELDKSCPFAIGLFHVAQCTQASSTLWPVSESHFRLVFSASSLRKRQWHPTPVLLPGKSHGWRSLVGCSPWGCYKSDRTERLHFQLSLSCIGGGNGNPHQCGGVTCAPSSQYTLYPLYSLGL